MQSSGFERGGCTFSLCLCGFFAGTVVLVLSHPTKGWPPVCIIFFRVVLDMLHSGLKVSLLQKWCFYWILTVHSCTGGVNISYNHLLFCEHQEFFFSSMNCFSFMFGMMLSPVTAEDNPLVLTWFYKLWELKSEITSLHSSGLCLWVCYDKCVVDSVLKLVFDCTYTELLHLVTTSHHLHVHTHTHTQKGLLVRLGCCSSSKSSVGRYILTTIRNGWVVSEWPPLQLPLATWERSYSYLGLARVRWQPGRFLFLTHTHPSASLESAWYERLSLRREAKEQQREECL